MIALVARPGDDVIVLRGRQAGLRGHVVGRSKDTLSLIVGVARHPATVNASDVVVAERHFANMAHEGATYVDQGAGAPRGIDPRFVYGSVREVRRAALVDPTAPPPVKETYFTETPRIVRSVNGRALKKPRTYIVPGAAPGTVAFVDYHEYGGPSGLYIDYVAVRPDLRNKGLGRQLIEAFYRDAAAHGVTLVHWGQVMNKHAWALMQRMKTAFPAIQTLGKHMF
jgi:GNAT superfamily N-acetyltransferase